MSEKINSNAYLLPAEFMEPQRPVTPNEFSVVKKERIEDAQLRSIPESLNPVYMQSAKAEKVVKGGKDSEFNKTQDAAYVEREASRNVWLERNLGEVALETMVVAPVSPDVLSIPSVERESRQEAGMNFKVVEELVGSLQYANENIRTLPEAEGRHNLNAYIVNKADGMYDGFKTGKISSESYSVMANALLGAASSRDSIDTVVGMLMDSETLDMDARADLSSHASTIKEIASVTGLDGERARISFANSLIARSEHLLKKNNNVADNRYRAMVGFIAGLSTQIKDPSTSNGFVHGALNELRKHS